MFTSRWCPSTGTPFPPIFLLVEKLFWMPPLLRHNGLSCFSSWQFAIVAARCLTPRLAWQCTATDEAVAKHDNVAAMYDVLQEPATPLPSHDLNNVPPISLPEQTSGVRGEVVMWITRRIVHLMMKALLCFNTCHIYFAMRKYAVRTIIGHWPPIINECK